MENIEYKHTSCIKDMAYYDKNEFRRRKSLSTLWYRGGIGGIKRGMQYDVTGN